MSACAKSMIPMSACAKSMIPMMELYSTVTIRTSQLVEASRAV